VQTHDIQGKKVAMIVFLILLALLGISAPNATAGIKDEPIPTREVSASRRLPAEYARLPLSFERNLGQTDRRVKFLARGPHYTLFLTSDEAVLALQQNGARQGKPGAPSVPPAVVRVRLVGANDGAQVSGLDELPGRSNYFVGNDPQGWHTQIPTYAKVLYRNAYPGIDAVYYGRQGQMETDYVVKPGGDAGLIRMGIEGAQKLEVDREGNLVLQVDGGAVRFERPVAYQENGGRRSSVAAHYALAGQREVKVEVGQYDHRSPLIIDPVLIYSTYLGGTGGDVAYGIAVDSSGNAYVTGSTASNDFPITSAIQPDTAGDGDVFVTKLNAAGTGLIYSTFLGGGKVDTATCIAIDASGNAYVAGQTTSPDFPTSPGGFQLTYGGIGDGFVAKIGPAGSTLIYSSFLGGSAPDSVQAIGLDPSGSAYLAGSTQSSDFPTVTPLQVGNDGCTTINGAPSCSSDAFVAKVSPEGTKLEYSTYLGGSDADYGQGIAVDNAGIAYVSGYTYSTDFPTQNAFQSSNRGGVDAFLTALNATGTTLVYSTYLGGSGQDRVFGMAIDAIGSIYLVGDTTSKDFPTTANSFQSSNAGQGDAFVCKLSPGATSLVYSTLLGGAGVDQASGVALDSSGNAYVTGFTNSSDFPTVDPLQRILGVFGASSCGTAACTDAFIAHLLTSGQVVYTTYLGGSGADTGRAIAVDSNGQAYVAGSTGSVNFPAIAGASQGAYVGTGSTTNAFIAKVSSDDAPAVALNPQQINFGNQTLNNISDPLAVTLTNPGSLPLTITSVSASGDFAQTNNCGQIVPGGGGTCTIQITFTPAITGLRTDQISITDNAAGNPQVVTVTGTGITSAVGSLTLTPGTLNFPAETVGSTSPAQVVHLANTGKSSIALSTISVTSDFTETNTCGSLPNVLNVGDGCDVSITFTPTATGNRTGTLVVTSNAAGSKQSATLIGTGNAVFSLSASSRSTALQIGTASTTFVINASSPSSFTGSITLSCTGGATCSFNPATITAGESSTVTVSGLSASTANPFNFSVSGTSSGQTATVTLAIFFSDFKVSVTPTVQAINAGQSASYTVTVTPTNNFNGVVLLGCGTLPTLTTCTWSPSALNLSGTTLTAIVTVKTTTQTTSSKQHPRNPIVPLGPGTGLRVWALWLVAFSLLAFAAWRKRTEAGHSRLSGYVRLAAVCVSLAMATAGFGCNNYYNVDNITLAGTGTPSGNYTIRITGVLGNNGTVSHSTSINLAVGAG
jgi:hypothetical protein